MGCRFFRAQRICLAPVESYFRLMAELKKERFDLLDYQGDWGMQAHPRAEIR